MTSVSAVITCYNQEGFVRGALDSVLAQTAPELAEIIVVDDGSSDGSPELIKRLASQDSRIIPILKPNGGASSARNAGIERATSDYVAFLDGDDLWLPEKLKVQLDWAKRLPQAGLLFSDFVGFNEDTGQESPVLVRQFDCDDPDPLEKLFLKAGPVLPSAALVRRDAFERCGMFDTSMRYNEDPEMWLRIAAAFPLQRTPGILVRKREVEGSLGSFSAGNADAQREITRRVIAAHPRLAKHRRRREARVEMLLSSSHAQAGDRRSAANAAWKAVRATPQNPRVWVALALMLTPRPLARMMKESSGASPMLPSREP